jgi:predicted transcriptional regulator
LPSRAREENLRGAEYTTLRRALDMTPLRRDAARLLGISPRALSYYLAKYPSLDGRA